MKTGYFRVPLETCHEGVHWVSLATMPLPTPPYDEGKRLEALRKLHLLDTPPEERFDRLVNLTQLIFKVPIAYISMVEADRQWFKSVQGLAVTQTPRDISFCQYPILFMKPLIVPNTLEDERFAQNPLVAHAPKVRFYAGAPIILDSGYPVATICIMDIEPRSFSAEDLEILQEIGALVKREFELTEILAG